ncbi:MAG: nucleotidyltransferase domain-containing protein [Anaerolineae bacterium]
MSAEPLALSIAQPGSLLGEYDFVEFAVLFGSFARHAQQPWSDLDIGIYVSRSLSLWEQGQLTAAVERHVGREVDLVILNTALDRNPALAYRAVSEGTLLFCRDHEAFVTFKTRAMLRYLDTAYLRATTTRAFQRRIETGKFGRGD